VLNEQVYVAWLKEDALAHWAVRATFTLIPGVSMVAYPIIGIPRNATAVTIPIFNRVLLILVFPLID
jgi:hypothetical protein